MERSVNFDQGEFDFDANGPDHGYRKWRQELDLKKRIFESRWGVVIGRRVSVELRNHAKPLTGMLELLEKRRPGSHEPLLRLKNLVFPPSEIVSIVRVEPEGDGR